MTKPTGRPQGRPPGSRNKRDAAHVEQLLERYASPLEFLMMVAAGVSPPSKDPKTKPHPVTFAERMEAAKAAAPYCHAKLKELSGPDGGPIPLGGRIQIITLPDNGRGPIPEEAPG